MAKNKGKGNDIKKQEPMITEEERNNNPIFKTVYKRIRNLNKKLSNIDALKELDEKSLKPEQLSKIAGRNEVESEIKKNQQFALFYKGILDECGGASFDNSQDLIKIATLIAVGQNIDRTRNLGEDKTLHHTHSKTYKNIVHHQHETSKQLVDRIGDIFGVLANYLKDPAQYKALQDYISFMPKTQQVSETILQQKKQAREIKQSHKPKIQQKQKQPQTQVKEDSKKHGNANLQKVQKIQTQVNKQSQKKSEERKQQKQPTEHLTQKVEIVTMAPNKEIVVTKEQNKQKTQLKNQQEGQETKQKGNVQNNQNIGAPQQSRKTQNGQQNQSYYHKNQGRQYNNNNNGYYKKNYNNYNNDRYNNNNYRKKYTNGDDENRQYKGKNYNNRATQNTGAKKVTRKDSDTSLEPTPEKEKVLARPKYIQKD